MKRFHKTRSLKTRSIYTRSHSQYITSFLLRLGIAVIFILSLIQISNAQQFQGKEFNNVNEKGIIIDGYDAVAFFTDNKPVKGDSQFQVSYKNAVYHFASQDHLDLFKAKPEMYRPQFGGWCAYAVSLGRIAPIDVNTFSIVDGRLVIQHNQRAVNGWNKDISGNLKLADKYWPDVAGHGGHQIITDEEKSYLNNTDAEGVILQGFDAVAYITKGKAIKGNPEFTARYNGATYWFSSQEHANLFKDKPYMFAPQYGGFCGYAMSVNKLRPIDPFIFQILDGRLILQHTQDAYVQFNKHVEENTKKADHNWPGQVKKHAGRTVKFDKPAKN